LKGMNLFNPRWSTKLRLTKVEVEYKLVLNTNDINRLPDDEIFNRLSSAMQHDEVEYQHKEMNKLYSRHKAEHISHALYVCPECHSIDTFRAKGNSFACSKCNYDIHINYYGFFERISDGKLFFDNIRDWYYWEENWLLDDVTAKLNQNYKKAIFTDKSSKIYHAVEMDKTEFMGTADISLFIEHIEIKFVGKDEKWELNFDDLQTINPQVHEQLEIIYNNEAYMVFGNKPGVSALKWEVALNAIWKKLGQNQKLSVYIEQ
ncbi:MAG: hypothetical protein ABFS35_21170, partial [Bacteroidota bacterium]